jgi:hypothetical protein
MKKGLFRGLLALAATLSFSSFAAHSDEHAVCDGFVPPNEMKIPVGAVNKWNFLSMAPNRNGGLTEEKFNAVIDRFIRLFEADINKAGGKLVVNRLWTSETVNASAEQRGGDWIINMYGGLARHPAITVEGFALVVCHEAGHHIGGAPKKSGRWATNEGGADYFAGLKCLRRFFAEDDNEAEVGKASIDALVKERCESQFTQRADQLLCMRSSLGGNSVALLFMDLRRETTPPGFGTPDSKVVTSMYDAHPATQCRMDTYFNGATCKVDVNVPVSQTDYKEGSCIQPQYDVGFRPLCWFKPTDDTKNDENNDDNN